MRFLFIIPLIISVSALAKPCGLEGEIEERIKDCDQIKGHFALVAITEKGMEFYRDQKSGLVWGYRIGSDFNQYGSMKACSENISGYHVLKSLKWRLPTISEFKRAAANGMKAIVPNMDRSYWTSTPVKRKRYRRRRRPPPQAYLWDAREERTDTGDLKDAASVRCVAKG